MMVASGTTTPSRTAASTRTKAFLQRAASIRAMSSTCTMACPRRTVSTKVTASSWTDATASAMPFRRFAASRSPTMVSDGDRGRLAGAMAQANIDATALLEAANMRARRWPRHGAGRCPALARLQVPADDDLQVPADDR